MSARTPAAGGWRPLHAPVDAGRRLFEPSAFSRLAVTHVLAMGGDALITMALAGTLFFSISPGEARGKVALSLLLTMAPFAVVAPLLGPAIDHTRRGRRIVASGACGGRVVACLFMADLVDSLLLFPAAFATLVLSKTYSVAKSSLVPSAVDGDHELVEANAKLSVAGVVGGFVAAVPGVVVLRLLGSPWVLRLAAVAFTAAAVASLRVVERRDEGVVPGNRPDTPGPEPLPPRQGAPSPERAAAQLSSLTIAAAAVAMALLRAIVGFTTFLVAFGFRRDDAPAWWFGIVLAASMAAGLAGAAVAPRLRTRWSEERILLTCLLLGAVAGLGLARLGGRIWVAGIAAAVGVAASAGKLAFDSLVQRDAPDAVRGRSFARFEAGFQLCWVVGALLPVVVATPLRLGMDVIGIACLLGGVAYFAAGRHLTRRTAGPVAR